MKLWIWPLFFVVGAAVGVGMERWLGSQHERAEASLPDASPLPPAVNPVVAEAKVRPWGAALGSLQEEDTTRNRLTALKAIEQMSTGEIAAALEPLRNVSHHPLKYELLAGWLERDADAALQFVLGQMDRFTRQADLGVLFRHWAAYHPSQALEAALALPKQSRDIALGPVLDRMAQTNPARAYHTLQDLDLGADRAEQLAVVFRGWARTDPEGAKATIEGLPPGAEREAAWSEYLNGLFQSDPATAAQALSEIEVASTRQEATTSLLYKWMRQDVDAAFSFVTTLPAGAERDAILGQFLTMTAFDHPRRTTEWARENMQGQARDKVVSDAIQNLARNDPEAAASLVKELPFGEAYEMTVRMVAMSWADRDPPSAWQWASELPPGEEQRSAIALVALRFAEADAEGAAAFAATLDDPSARETIFEGIARIKGQGDPRAALAWAETLSPEVRDSARESLIFGWVWSDPKGIIDYLAENPSETLTVEQYRQLGWKRAEQDGAAAAAWALSLPDAEAQSRAVGSATRTWLRQDTYAASAWIEELPPGRTRDRAAVNVIDRILPSDPAAAFAWATSLRDGTQRRRWTEDAAEAWGKGDAGAARAAIEASELPAHEKADLLRELER